MKKIRLRWFMILLLVICLCGIAGVTVFADGASEGSKGVMQEGLTAIELTKLMGNGINLGNTMEAYGRSALGVGADVLEYETYWGQPVTTQEIISSMKTAGFNTLRIPVAWTNAINFETGDYTIGEDYLDRVEEIINYALNEDMYIIVNDHWDGGWWGMFGSASEETRDAAMDLYISMWTQIAERYKDYGDHLIFESANEELGNRLNDTDIAADSGTLSTDECYEMTNKINQGFVDTVRAAGGNNGQRFLLIAGYGTDIVSTCDERFQMPYDSANSKLLISIHYYDPSGYTINTALASWGTKEDYEEQNSMLSMMTKFTDQGYGVVIGEYSVVVSDGWLKDNTLDYIKNLLNNSDIYGYCPVLWDCNNLFSKSSLGFISEELADLYTEHSLAVQSEMTDEEIIEKAINEMEQAIQNAESSGGVSDDESIAWIMYNSGDWSTMYSSGDTYDPTSKTAGIESVDVKITGEGTYTVSLDFTGTYAGYANGVVFSALGIANGEILFPDYVVSIEKVLINGVEYELKGKPYTTSDDGKCTRVNLYNAWVSDPPTSGRTEDGILTDATSRLLDAETIGNVETISVTFYYGPVKSDSEDETTDYTAAKEVIDEAEKLLGELDSANIGDGDGQYPQTAVDALKNAINTAKSVVDDTNAAQEEVDQAKKDLRKAIEDFQNSLIQLDFSELDYAITQAEVLNEPDYTAASWDVLKKALTAGKTIRETKGVTQAKADAAVEEIYAAIAALESEYLFTTSFDTFTGSGSVSATVNAPFDNFISLSVDDVTLDQNCYTVTEGSTVITLKETYLKTLANGTYVVTALFTDGTASTTLSVNISGTKSVTGVTLDWSDAKVTVGKTLKLTAAVTPSDAANQNLIWSSSDASIAAVDANGKITGIKVGSVIITVTTEDGSYTATCKVTVTAADSSNSKTSSGTRGTVKTGDNENIWLWISLLGVSVLVVLGICLITKRKLLERKRK